MKNIHIHDKADDILLVDDMPENLKALSGMLTRSGYKTRLAQSGKQALRSIKAKPPAITLLDIRMPEMDGYEVCRQLKADQAYREIPVIFISALDEPMDKVKAFEAGAVDYIPKPFNSDEVLARIRTHLNLGKLRKELEVYNKKLEELVRERTAELEKSRERYRRLMEDLPVGLFRTTPGPEGRFLMANPAIAKMFGFETVEELKQLPVTGFYNDSDRRGSFSEKLIEKGFLANEELKLKKRNGASLIGSVTAHVVRDQRGKAHYFDGMIEDITERKGLEQQLNQAQKMEAIGTLAGGISHDFNNILAVVIGYTELALLGMPENSPQRSDLKRVLKASNRAKQLVNQILLFSRRGECEKKPLLLAPIIKETLKFIRSSLPSTIEIRSTIAEETGAILADPIQMQQVLMNLCTNAAHAMHEKGGILEIDLMEVDLTADDIKRIPELTPGPHMKITVSDTGCGMESMTLEHIFDPFFTTKRAGEGTGLGLSVVHGIIKNSGGVIHVHSELNEGAVFHILLPKIQKSGVKDVPDMLKQLPRGTEQILLVDDEKTFVDVLERSLKYLGYKVVAQTNRVEALETFRAHPESFDLIITDQIMPDMKGADLATMIIAIKPHIPIIVCTGSSESIPDIQTEEKNVLEILMKPVILNKLAETVRRVLDT